MSEDGFCNAAQKLYLSAYYSVYDKLDSTVNSYSRISTWSDDSVCSPEEIKRKTLKDCSSSHDCCYRMAEGLAEKVDFILVKLSKLDKLDDIEPRPNNFATSVSSIEISMSQLETEVSVLD